MPSIPLRALAVWSLLLVLAIANGGLRDALLAPRLDEATAHVVSTLMLATLIFVVTWLTAPWLRLQSARQAWAVGAAWLVMTVAFEFGAGHYLFGQSWSRLLSDYDVAQGRIWPLVLVVDLLAPPVAFRWRARRSAG